MIRFRYTAWDGSQEVKLDPEQIFDRFAEYLAHAENLDDALDALLRDGMQGDGFEVVGLDELIDQVEKRLEDLFHEHTLDHALSEQKRRLEESLEAEADRAEQSGDEARRQRMRELIEKLRNDLAGALRDLAEQDLLDPDAKMEVEFQNERLDDIDAVSEFIRRYGNRFDGDNPVDLDGALDLEDEIRRLEELLNALRSRDLDGIDPESAGAAMGPAFADALENLKDMIQTLVSSGYMTPRGSRMELSPKGARKIGQLALREINKELAFDAGGRHETTRRGPMEASMSESRPYRFGDPMHLDASATVRSALLRSRDGARPAGERRVPLEPEDLHVFEANYNTRSSTVLLLDMSWSMSWEGRFAAAKKVALAMETLMRTRYPRDFFGVVGFYTRAVELKLRDLPEATWNMGDPFTNLQDGLRMASNMLAGQPGTNKNVIVITDGQPTAYFSGGKLFCEWPMSMGGLSTRATIETLDEVRRVTRQGVVINTFMLDDSPQLRAFVEKMTDINKGRAFYTTPDQLGRFLMVDYVGRRKKVI